MDEFEKIAGYVDNEAEAYALGRLAGMASRGISPGLEKSAAGKKAPAPSAGDGLSALAGVAGRGAGLVGGAAKSVLSGLAGAGRGLAGFGGEVARDALEDFAHLTDYDIKAMELDALRAEYLREAERLRRAVRVAGQPAASGNPMRMRL